MLSDESSSESDDSVSFVTGKGRVIGRYRYARCIAVCASLNNYSCGFVYGVLAGVGYIIKTYFALSDWEEGFFFAVPATSACIGALLSSTISDRCGRSATFLLCQILFVVSASVAASAPTFHVLIFGEFISGIGVGLGLGVNFMYISEIAPSAVRGQMTTMAEVIHNMGFTMGYIVSYLLSDLDPAWNWRLMLASGGLLPLVKLLLYPAMLPESPRWLVQVGREEEAKAVLRRLSPGEEENIVIDIKEELQALSDVQWLDVFMPAKGIRLSVYLAMFMGMSQEITGIEMVMNYQPTMLEQAGVSNDQTTLFKLTVLMGFWKIGATVITMWLADSWGRKKPLILGVLICAASSFFIVLGAQGLFPSIASLLLIWIFVAGFAVGPGPIAWIYVSELSPLPFRAKVSSIAVILNRLVSSVNSVLFLPVSNFLGMDGSYFLLLSLLSAFMALGFYILLPETMGMKLESTAHNIEQ